MIGLPSWCLIATRSPFRSSFLVLDGRLLLFLFWFWLGLDDDISFTFDVLAHGCANLTGCEIDSESSDGYD